LLVVNKPAGLASQGGQKYASGGNAHDNLLARILFYLQENGAHAADFTPAICNRLDTNTSGLVICGKTLHALQTVNSLFAKREIKKEYLAIACGAVGNIGETRTLENFYEKNTQTNTAKILTAPLPTENSNIVITSYTVLAVSQKYSLLSVSPITGRSHQIRAHLAHISHPLAGDKKYGGDTSPAKHQLLHCRRLEIAAKTALPYPSGTAWEAAPPKNMAEIIRKLFNYRG